MLLRNKYFTRKLWWELRIAEVRFGEAETQFVDKCIYKCISLGASVILEANGFDWDRGNRAKCEKHGLSIAAIESLFARRLAILPDACTRSGKSDCARSDERIKGAACS